MPGLSVWVRPKRKAAISIKYACVKQIKIYFLRNASVGTRLLHLFYPFTQIPAFKLGDLWRDGSPSSNYLCNSTLHYNYLCESPSSFSLRWSCQPSWLSKYMAICRNIQRWQSKIFRSRLAQISSSREIQSRTLSRVSRRHPLGFANLQAQISPTFPACVKGMPRWVNCVWTCRCSICGVLRKDQKMFRAGSSGASLWVRVFSRRPHLVTVELRINKRVTSQCSVS